ncbi:hypothetical protein F8R89_30730 [Streptomyces sp. SS1-1]|uniref:hypothetical protein n=1 Tax=Streptomyces sp. SS1-1 TaxID=2651869 RepID=UPI00124FDFA9|nr:hypothetical protein [Streptomyces sp. SS1-1]KAB2975986.1 hypothetical protein F8R89_30730 [Streptomyces sp. SS1-1]
MNTKAVNSAADVIHAALTQNRRAISIALALDSAQLLQSPETAAELERLRARVAELEAASEVDNETLDAAAEALRARPVAEVYAERARHGTPAERTAYRMLHADATDGEHYAVVHHDYRLGHDLPETGGTR